MCAAKLGMLGDGSWTANTQRPYSWREEWFRLNPNGDSPLNAILSKTRSAGTATDARHGWFMKRRAARRLQINGGTLTAAATSITVVSDGKFTRDGVLLRNERTGEVMRSTADGTDTGITVERGVVSAGIALADQDYLYIIGNSTRQGANTPTAVSYGGVDEYNYVQTFRNPISISRMGALTKYRTGDARQDKRMDALDMHMADLERATIFGQRSVDTTDPDKPEYTMGGIISYLTTNVYPNQGALSQDAWDDILVSLGNYGSSERVAFCGSTALSAINRLAAGRGRIELLPSASTYGIDVHRYETTGIVLNLIRHPEFCAHPEYTKAMLILDMKNIGFVPFIGGDTRLVPRIGDPYKNNPAGTDAYVEEYMTDCTIVVDFEETHAWIPGLTGWNGN